MIFFDRLSPYLLPVMEQMSLLFQYLLAQVRQYFAGDGKGSYTAVSSDSPAEDNSRYGFEFTDIGRFIGSGKSVSKSVGVSRSSADDDYTTV